jgi:hypothetical protein
MIQWLKKYFIPHEENDHKPHFLRTKVILAILSVLLFIEVIFLLGTTVIYRNTNLFASILPQVLVENTNNNRELDNLSPLKINPTLEKAAYQKAEDMASRAYFSHNTPDGLTPWYWLEKAGYKFEYAGENLAINFADSEDVVNAWMNSLSHRANILNKNFTEIGIGTARGAYQGRETIFVVQFFGKPALAEYSEITSLAKVPIAEAREIIPPSETSKPDQTVILAVPRLPSDMYVVTKNTGVLAAMEEIQPPPNPTIHNNPNAGSTAPNSFMAKILGSPRAYANFLYIVLFTIVALAIVLKIFIRIDIQHPRLIVNGLLILMFIASTLLLNKYLLLLGTQIS